MEQTYIEIGTIVNTHGVRGELKLLPRDIDAEVLASCKTLYIDGRAVTPRSQRLHKGCLLFHLEGVPDLDAALPYKGKTVSAHRADLALPEGVYLPAELLGVAVLDAETGEELGKIDQVLTYPAHKIYAVRGGKDEYLVPAVPAFIAAVNLPGGTVEIHMIEGLGTHS